MSGTTTGNSELQPRQICAGLPVTNHETCDCIVDVLVSCRRSMALAALLVSCASHRPSGTAVNSATTAPASTGHAVPAGATKADRPVAKRDASSPSRPATKPDAEPLSLKASKEQLYQRACELGSALACNDLGVLVEADRKAAIPLFEKSCGLGLPRGCTNWAVLLMDDKSHHNRIVELLRGACDKKDGLACNRLGDWLYSLDDSQNKVSEIHRIYDRGCVLENWDACASSAWMLKAGLGTSPDPTLARDRFRLACDHERYHGCLGLGISLLEDNPRDQQRDYAVSLVEKSCDKSIAAACYYHGALLVSQDGTIPKSAHRQFERACQLGDERGCKLVPLDALPPSEDAEEQ
jgi:TPR repeat protein